MELLRRTVIRVKWREKRLLPLSPTFVAAGKKQRKREKDCIASPSACASRAPRKGEPRQNNGHDRDREASWAICIKLNNQPARIIDRRHGRDCATVVRLFRPSDRFSCLVFHPSRVLFRWGVVCLLKSGEGCWKHCAMRRRMFCSVRRWEPK